VVRQLDALRQCTKPAAIKRALTSLPKDLDETYNRILLRMQGDDECYKDALAVLQWLAVATRPPTLYEVAEVIAVSPGSAAIDEDNRLFDAKELLSICSGLVILVNDDSEIDRLRLTHYSVKEYLLSARIRSSPASEFALDDMNAHKFAAQVCVTYLLSFKDEDVFMAAELNDVAEHESSETDSDLPKVPKGRPTKKVAMTPKSIFRKYPLLRYAARYWSKHVRALPSHEAANLHGHIEHLLDRKRSASCLNWLRASNTTSTVGGGYNFALKANELQPPLYYAAFLGLATVVQAMLTKGANLYYVRDSGHSRRTLRYPLHAAVARGHNSVVRLLLSHGEGIHNENEYDETPLQVACDYGRLETAELLLQEGADVNRPVNSLAEDVSLPLQAAAGHNDERLTTLLLDKGADVNAQSGFHCNALQRACRQGYENIVNLLIDRAASVIAYGGHNHSPLQAAAATRNAAICKILINHGADVNAAGGEFGTALQAACCSGGYEGQENFICFLIDNSADVNAQGGRYGSPLHAACVYGQENIVRLLIRHSADVNAQGGRYGTPLNAACRHSHDSIVNLLLDNGADINLDDLGRGTPLQAVAATNNEARFMQFLGMGANLDVSGGDDGSPLQAAIARENDAMVDLILSKGAKVNSVANGKFGFPLQAAAFTDNIPIAEKMLGIGSEINALGGKYGSALIAAAFCGHQDMAQFLLDRGADVNTIGGKYGTAIFAAAFFGRLEMARVLLENGADATMCTDAGNPAGAALKGRKGPHEDVIELLESHGATDELLPADYAEHCDDWDSDIDYDESGEEDYFDTESADLSGDEWVDNDPPG